MTNYKNEIERLLCLYFPQYPPLEYRNISPISNTYLMETNLFDINIRSFTSFNNLVEAEEETAKLCVDLLTSFLSALKMDFNDDDKISNIGLKEVFDPLIKFMKEFKPKSISVDNFEGANEVISEDKWRLSFVAEEMVGPLLDNIQEDHGRKKEFTIDEIANYCNNGISPFEKIIEIQDSTSNIAEDNAISFLFQHWQKKSHTLQPPTFDFFTKGQYHGCSLSFDGHSIIIPAIYKKRMDAKCEAARKGVECIFGTLKKFDPIKPDDPLALLSWNKDCNISHEMLNIDHYDKKAQFLTSSPSTQLKIPNDILDIKPPSGLNFVSLVNEYCQLNRLDVPIFKSITRNEGLNVISFCCSIESFVDIDCPIISQSFSKKSDAKNDCAGRLYKKMCDKGMIDSVTGKSLKKQIPIVNRFSNPIKRDHTMFMSPSPPPPPPPRILNNQLSEIVKYPLDPKFLEYLMKMKKEK